LSPARAGTTESAGAKASVSSASGRDPRGFSASVSRGWALPVESLLALSRDATALVKERITFPAASRNSSVTGVAAWRASQ